VKKKKAGKKSLVERSLKGSGHAKAYIVGESPMVEEYAILCAAKGYEVLVQWNVSMKSAPDFGQASIRQTAVIPVGVSVGIELTNNDPALKQKNLQRLDKALSPTVPILSSSVTVTAMEQAGWISQRHRLVGFCALPTFSEKPLAEVAPTVFSPKETIEVVRLFLGSIGKEIVLVQDRVGMVLPRILCQIVNEAAFALQEDVASPRDLDTAMKLGTNYPYGPVEWANRIGMRNVYIILTAMEQDLKEDRYRVAPLLKQMAQAGPWWKTE
jgi:3-hydroxybutyryl-CoA dehydrogenase